MGMIGPSEAYMHENLLVVEVDFNEFSQKRSGKDSDCLRLPDTNWICADIQIQIFQIDRIDWREYANYSLWVPDIPPSKIGLNQWLLCF